MGDKGGVQQTCFMTVMHDSPPCGGQMGLQSDGLHDCHGGHGLALKGQYCGIKLVQIGRCRCAGPWPKSRQRPGQQPWDLEVTDRVK